MSETTVDVAAIPARVAAGAAWLDREQPGWWRKIYAERLDLGNDCRCILGQLWDSYSLAVEALNISNPVHLGFDATLLSDDSAVRRDAEYAELTTEWKRVIQARRAQAGA